MPYRRPLGHEEGQALVACSICGFPYRWPRELIRGDDGHFYCLRTCWLGETRLTHDQKHAQFLGSLKDDGGILEVPAPKPGWR